MTKQQIEEKHRGENPNCYQAGGTPAIALVGEKASPELQRMFDMMRLGKRTK
ncbi:MAG: hypothetical protein WC657_06980 [Candidatus Paceibacterota bacterium]